jgi:hypothetical protein
MSQQYIVMSSAGLPPKSDCSGKAQKQLYSKLQTLPLVREGTPREETRNCQTKKKNLAVGCKWEPDTKTDWFSIRKKFALTSPTSGGR